ncbi:hypothetical protein [Tropicimonas sp. IMCC34043]|uniref:hypothetical protein n=1 Tax=Tropicimonas sp. IMCC34043 TaxID=2248760 RepID=UPI000E22EF19|nr:hypothetical protein [Tropicimonas sp. IMCC34043]
MSEFIPSPALARAAEHYNRLRGQTVEVPEWGDECGPLVIHFDPVTAAQAQAVTRRAAGSDAKATALAVILYSKDADGNPVFEDNGGTLQYFMTKVDPKIVAKIGKAIMGLDAREDADELGN